MLMAERKWRSTYPVMPVMTTTWWFRSKRKMLSRSFQAGSSRRSTMMRLYDSLCCNTTLRRHSLASGQPPWFYSLTNLELLVLILQSWIGFHSLFETFFRSFSLVSTWRTLGRATYGFRCGVFLFRRVQFCCWAYPLDIFWQIFTLNWFWCLRLSNTTCFTVVC